MGRRVRGFAVRSVRRRVVAAVAVPLVPAVTGVVLHVAHAGAGDARSLAEAWGGSSTTSSSGLVVGAGPQAPYTVQPQPAPGSCHYRWIDKNRGLVLPDPSAGCTPGATNPRVTQGNLAQTICRKGYTASIRPPLAITSVEKRASAKAYSYSGNLALAEEDHELSLELGGDPNDPRNMWVEPNSAGATSVNNPKDQVENWLNNAVCDAVHLASQHKGTATTYLPVATAQRLIASDWTTAVEKARRELVHG